MGGFSSRPVIEIPVMPMPVLRPNWMNAHLNHAATGTHYSASNFSEETPDYRIHYACQNNECRAEVFDIKLNKGMAFTIKDGKCFYNEKQISKTALLDIAHKESLTPLVNLLVHHAGFELPTHHRKSVLKLKNDSGSRSSKKKKGSDTNSKSRRSYVK